MKNLFLALTLFGSCSLFAADGSSGCGPGWYLFKENSLVSSAFRATTNGILFPSVTFGMTFGTSNCTQHKLVLKEKESLHFVTENYFEVQADMARGVHRIFNVINRQDKDFGMLNAGRPQNVRLGRVADFYVKTFAR